MDLRQAINNGAQSWRRVPKAPAVPRHVHHALAHSNTALSRVAHVAFPVSCSSAAVGSVVSTTTAAEQAAALFGQDHHSSVERGSELTEASSICPAVLQTRLSKAHSSAVSAAIVVQDTLDEKLVVTASLDKGVAAWRFYTTGSADGAQGSVDESIEVTRLKVPGAPVFSLAKIPDVLPDGTVAKRVPTGKPSGIYLGTAAKEVLTWMLGSKDVTNKIVLGGHTGWVRSLAVTGKWLFSCGCNFLRLWDTTFRTPKEADSVRLFTGDILAIAASQGQVFTAGADGSLRSWTISRGGELEAGPAVERAHEGRVVGCLVAEGRVYTTSYDGSVKAWSASGLQLLAEVRAAHGGEKVLAAALGVNGVLFTGGDDKMVRAWAPDTLAPLGPPLDGHGASVRVLAAGRRGILVSGDADGDVCIWGVCDVVLPPPQQQQPVAAAGVAAALGAVAVAPPTLQQLEDLFAAPSRPSPAQQQEQEQAQAVEQQPHAAEALVVAPEAAAAQDVSAAAVPEPVAAVPATATPSPSVEPWVDLPPASEPAPAVPEAGVVVAAPAGGLVNGHAVPLPLETAPLPMAMPEPEPAAMAATAVSPQLVNGHVNGHAAGVYANGHTAAVVGTAAVGMVAPEAEVCDWTRLDDGAGARSVATAAPDVAATPAAAVVAVPAVDAVVAVAAEAAPQPEGAAAAVAAPAPVVAALQELEVEDVASAVAVAVLTKEADARAAAAAAAAEAAAEAEAAAAAAAEAAAEVEAEATLAALAAQVVANAEAAGAAPVHAEAAVEVAPAEAAGHDAPLVPMGVQEAQQLPTQQQ